MEQNGFEHLKVSGYLFTGRSNVKCWLTRGSFQQDTAMLKFQLTMTNESVVDVQFNFVQNPVFFGSRSKTQLQQWWESVENSLMAMLKIYSQQKPDYQFVDVNVGITNDGHMITSETYY